MAMSAQHKAALAQGRREARAIKLYLEALGSRRPGRPVTPVTLEKRVRDLEAKIASETDALKAVDLRQARIEAEQALARAASSADMAELETGFVKFAKSYSGRKGVSYAAWREAGVPAAMLRQAGISRAR